MKKWLLSLICISLFASHHLLLAQQPELTQKSDVGLSYYSGVVEQNNTLYIAITWSIPQPWHMQAPNEYMPRITWMLPEGLTLKKMHWPPPKPFISIATSGEALGYSGSVTALAEFQADEPFNVHSDMPRITAKVRWALCHDQCVPYSAEATVDQEIQQNVWQKAYAPRIESTVLSFALLAPFLFAFLGGVILNVMPCVLPVLSLKVLDFLTPSTYAPWVRGAAFTSGVCSGFAMFSAVILAMKKAGGSVLGWGFHMQSPWFVGFMMVLFMLMGLHMWGVFEVGTSLTRLSLPKWMRHPLGKAFGVGLITCGVSTPCTAPFMGSAVAYALTASSWHMLGVFLCLGLGLSAPIFLLTLIPAWLQFIPKPGMWMVRLKKFLSLGMFLTACWLAWVMSTLIYTERMTVDIPEIKKLLESDKPVLLDFTANWCMTCQVNKTVLESPDVQQALEEKGVQQITVDLTQENPEGFKLLARFQRSSIPLIVYSKGNGKYTLLPPLITKNSILKTIE